MMRRHLSLLQIFVVDHSTSLRRLAVRPSDRGRLQIVVYHTHYRVHRRLGQVCASIDPAYHAVEHDLMSRPERDHNFQLDHKVPQSCRE